jgi:hypothetical protein
MTDTIRAERQPALHLIAAEICSLELTDGFCMPQNKAVCECWDRATAMIRSTGFSAQACAWILRNRTQIEKEAAK